MTLEEAVKYLERQGKSARPAGSYLVCGGTAADRIEAGRAFARAVLCSSDGREGPCKKCRDCRQAAANRHPDFHAIAGEGKNKLLQIDQVREIRKGIALAPYQARHRFYLVDIANIREDAANAFLKTLEEPPETAVITILSRAGHDLLPTILSRLRKIRLPAVAPENSRIEEWSSFFKRKPSEPRLIFNLAKKIAAYPEDKRGECLDSLAGIFWMALRSRAGIEEGADGPEWLPQVSQGGLSDQELLEFARDAMRKRQSIARGTASARLAIETVLLNYAASGKNGQGQRAGN